MGCFLCKCKQTEKEQKTEINKIDTIIKYDTITITKPQPIYITKTKTITDTLQLANDTVKVIVDVPIETKEYKDSLYYCKISGFKASLDVLTVFPKETTITKEITQYRAKKWGFTIGCGIGYDFNNKIKPFVGITYGYRF